MKYLSMKSRSHSEDTKLESTNKMKGCQPLHNDA